MAIFDSDLSCILAGISEEAVQIRALIRKATKKIKIEREGGTYTMRTWYPPPRKGENEGGFPRPGR